MEPSEKNRKILFFNPQSAQRNHRLPLSILQICASVRDSYDSVIVDGNLERDPLEKINSYLETGAFGYFACTVMPGPQLKQSIPFTKQVKERFPEIITIWGGYFPSIHPEVAIRSGYVDFVIYGPGEMAFRKLLDCLEGKGHHRLRDIENLVYREPGNQLIKTSEGPVPDPGKFPPLPLDHLSVFYDINRYIARTFMGIRTFILNTSLGCPYQCAFCGVASVYHASWKGKPASGVVREIMGFVEQYRIDAVEIIDSNFFSSHDRVIEFCRMMKGKQIRWWAEGRIDALGRFSDEELVLLRESGCRLVFMGAESGDEEVLKAVDKGGTVTPAMTEELVRRFRKAGIIPQLSFVLGLPSDDQVTTFFRMKQEISFIRRLKRINPETEIIPYLYSPVPGEGSQLGTRSRNLGFAFPEKLEDWLNPEWEEADLRKNPNTPWLSRKAVRYARDFETVMTAAYPGISNFRIKKVGKLLLGFPGKFRYVLRFYRYPLEIRFMLKLFRYQRPEKEGFWRE